MTHLRSTLVVVGHGMVGHRFVQAAIERGLTETHDIVVIGAERRPAYDRVALTSFFSAESADELSLLPDGGVRRPAGDAGPRRRGDRDRPRRTRGHLRLTGPGQRGRSRSPTRAASRRSGTTSLVLATGAAPFVPPVEGRDKDGCFVYRTIEDLEAIRAASGTATSGIVIGGGLLGLEAANALVQLGLRDPRRGDGAAADAGAARRRRAARPWSATSRSSASPSTPACSPRPSPATTPWPACGCDRPAPRRAPRRPRRSTPRSSCSPPASGPATRSPASAGSTSPSAAACSSTSSAAPPTRTSSPSASAPPRAGGCTAWWPRATRWPRSSSTPCARARAPSPVPTCPPSSSCSASTWRASATPSRPRPTRSSSSTPTPSRASTRSSWSPSPRTARSASSAGSWSATRRRTAPCARSWRAASRCRPTPRS